MTKRAKPPGTEETPAPALEAPPAKARPRKKGALKVRRIGNSLGVVLPKEVLARLRVGEGDELAVAETADGVVLTPHDDDVARQLEIGRDLMKRYRNALRELAK